MVIHITLSSHLFPVSLQASHAERYFPLVTALKVHHRNKLTVVVAVRQLQADMGLCSYVSGGRPANRTTKCVLWI